MCLGRIGRLVIWTLYRSIVGRWEGGYRRPPVRWISRREMRRRRQNRLSERR
jgi:hypothetical protein